VEELALETIRAARDRSHRRFPGKTRQQLSALSRLAVFKLRSKSGLPTLDAGQKKF
jgi:hypothetical protein